MKVFKIFAMAVVLFCLAACGDSSITLTSKKVDGRLGKFFEVVERNYGFNEAQITVELKRIADGGPTDPFSPSHPNFKLKLLDENGEVILKDRADSLSDSEELKKVFSLKVGESSSVTFAFPKASDEERQKVVQMEVSSFWDESKEGKDSDSSSDGSSSEATTSAKSGLQPSNIILPKELKGVVEIVNGENGSIDIYDGIGDIPHIDITFKLLKTVASTKSMANQYGQVFIFGVPQDNDGRTVKEVMPTYNEWRSNDSDGTLFKDFLTGDVGGTVTLSFSGTTEKYDSNCDNKKGVPKIAKFKLSFNKLD